MDESSNTEDDETSDEEDNGNGNDDSLADIFNPKPKDIEKAFKGTLPERKKERSV